MCRAGNLLRHGTHDETSQAAPSVAGDDNQIEVVRLCKVDDGPRRRAFQQLRMRDGGACGQGLLLGYTAPPERQIDAIVARLAKVLA